jgi:hypothetical protein
MADGNSKESVGPHQEIQAKKRWDGPLAGSLTSLRENDGPWRGGRGAAKERVWFASARV